MLLDFEAFHDQNPVGGCRLGRVELDAQAIPCLEILGIEFPCRFTFHGHLYELSLLRKPDRTNVGGTIALDGEGLVEWTGYIYFTQKTAGTLCCKPGSQQYQ